MSFLMVLFIAIGIGVGVAVALVQRRRAPRLTDKVKYIL